MRKVIVTAALTGGIHGKDSTPYLPEQPHEIIPAALEAAAAGAAVVHIHARSPEGKPTADTRIYKEILDGIRSKSDVIVQLTTGAGLGVPVAERMKIIELAPEMASLNVDNCVFLFKNQEFFYQNFRSEIEQFAKRMLELDVKPEIECYNYTSIDEVENLIRKGLLKKPYYINCVMNIPAQGAIRGTPKNLLMMVERLPADSIFNVCATGATQLPLTNMSVILGGQCRVGLEDNIYYRKGVLATSSAQLVERSIRIIKELELEVATPDEAREMLGIIRRQ